MWNQGQIKMEIELYDIEEQKERFQEVDATDLCMKENNHENDCRCVVHYLRDEDKENKLKVEFVEKTERGSEPQQSLMCIEKCEKVFTEGRVALRCRQTCHGYYKHEGPHRCREHESEEQKERFHREYNISKEAVIPEVTDESQEERERPREIDQWYP